MKEQETSAEKRKKSIAKKVRSACEMQSDPRRHPVA
jgi:hypothetical protein